MKFNENFQQVCSTVVSYLRKFRWFVILLALALAVLSASLDVVIDAWRTDVAHAEERGPAATAANLGYRASAYFAFSGALIIAQYYGWEITYVIMAGAMIMGARLARQTT